MRSIIENQIRLTLSAPPALASSDEERRAIYVASLLMYEQMLSAASDVDYLARPLPLFYALSQAGRAIVAAYGTGPQARGHGLGEDTIGERVTTTTIAPRQNGLFQAVADALRWSTLTGPVELGAVWSALPDLIDTPHDRPGDWPSALFVWPEQNEFQSYRFDHSNAVLVAPGRGPGARVFDVLDQYPHARHVSRQQMPGLPPEAAVEKPTPRGSGTLVRFLTDDGQSGLAIRDAVPEHRYAGEYWLVPTLATGDFLEPLQLWWVLLLGLSILARYEPARWRAALDVETTLAVPLEDLLDEALVAVPHWLLWALTARTVRISRPAIR